MAKRIQTDAETLEQIRAWYERHQYDYGHGTDVSGLGSPPKVWSEYFAWLLAHCKVKEPL